MDEKKLVEEVLKEWISKYSEKYYRGKHWRVKQAIKLASRKVQKELNKEHKKEIDSMEDEIHNVYTINQELYDQLQKTREECETQLLGMKKELIKFHKNEERNRIVEKVKRIPTIRCPECLFDNSSEDTLKEVIKAIKESGKT